MTTAQALESAPRPAQEFKHYTAHELNVLYVEDGGDYWPLPVSGDLTLLAR